MFCVQSSPNSLSARALAGTQPRTTPKSFLSLRRPKPKTPGTLKGELLVARRSGKMSSMLSL